MKDKLLQGESGWLRESPLADQGEFKRLYESSYLSVFRYIYGNCGGSLKFAEDITSEVFMRAWKARKKFKGDPQKGGIGWLITIAKRLIIDHYRKTVNQPVMVDQLLEITPMDGPEPEQMVLWSEEQQHLRLLLNKLPPRSKEILVLRYLLDWRVNQIAGYLNIPENTVSVIIRRSLEQIQSSWLDEIGGQND